MWPSEPGVSFLVMILMLPAGAGIVFFVGWILEKIREHGRGEL